MKPTKMHVIPPKYDGGTFEAQHGVVPNLEARIAIGLVERWGTVAGEPDGEDSAGRSRLRLQSVHDLVQRSVQTAAELVAALEQRGWLIELPAPETAPIAVRLRERLAAEKVAAEPAGDQ